MCDPRQRATGANQQSSGREPRSSSSADVIALTFPRLLAPAVAGTTAVRPLGSPASRRARAPARVRRCAVHGSSSWLLAHAHRPSVRSPFRLPWFCCGWFFSLSFEERRLHPLLGSQRHSHLTIRASSHRYEKRYHLSSTPARLRKSRKMLGFTSREHPGRDEFAGHDRGSDGRNCPR
jgi:hypothetical protein